MDNSVFTGGDTPQRKKLVLLHFSIFFIPLVIVLGSILLYAHYLQVDADFRVYAQMELRSVDLAASAIEDLMHQVSADTLILAEYHELREYLDENPDLQTESAAASEHLEIAADEYATFARQRKVYDQIRFISKSGKEIIRINQEDGKAIVISKAELQNKGDRYYFKEAMLIEPWELYISPLDLNIEQGQVEEPHKPMIRIATPVVDSEGSKRGVVVLNYLAANMLRALDQHTPTKGQVMLLNRQGYWLKSPTPEDEWGFMFPEKKHLTFEYKYGEIWQDVLANEADQQNNANGLFTFRTVHPLETGIFTGTATGNSAHESPVLNTCEDYDWKLVSFVPQAELHAMARLARIRNLWLFTIFSIILAIVCWVLARAQVARRAARQMVHQQYQFLNHVIESLTHPFLVIDARNHNVLLANQAALGDTPLGAQNCYQVNHGLDHPCAEDGHTCSIQEVSNSLQAQITERVSPGPDGKPRYLEVHSYPVEDANNEVIQIIEYSIDITKRKEAEAAIQQHTHALGERVKELNCLYQLSSFVSVPGLELEQLLQQVVAIIPPAWQYPEITVARIQIDELELSSPGFITTHAAQMASIQAGGKLRGQVEVAYLEDKPDLDEGPFLKEERDLIDAIADELARFIERKEAEQQLRHAQKVDAIGTLASGIAHDFNNILTAILGFSEMIRLDMEAQGQDTEDIDQVMIASQRAADLVRQILTFSRHQPRQIEDVQVSRLLVETLKLIRATHPATIEIKTNIQATEQVVTGDATTIHQVLMNLCTNAGFAMRETGGILNVDLREIQHDPDLSTLEADLPAGSFLKITVADTGVGMPPEIIEHIFDPFFTTRQAGEGTGLGLAVVRSSIAELGGAIAVYSKIGVGTTFTVYLPCTVGKSLAKPTVTAKQLRGSERVLVVDDEDAIRLLLSRHLTRLGYQVTSFQSSVDALAQFAAEPHAFDIIISDCIMPNMTGPEFAVQLGEINSEVPVFLCTGNGHEHCPDPQGAANVACVFVKPIEINALVAALREELDGKAVKSTA